MFQAMELDLVESAAGRHQRSLGLAQFVLELGNFVIAVVDLALEQLALPSEAISVRRGFGVVLLSGDGGAPAEEESPPADVMDDDHVRARLRSISILLGFCVGAAVGGGGGGEFLMVDMPYIHPLVSLVPSLGVWKAANSGKYPDSKKLSRGKRKKNRFWDRLVIFMMKITGDLPLSGSPTSDSEK